VVQVPITHFWHVSFSPLPHYLIHIKLCWTALQCINFLNHIPRQDSNPRSCGGRHNHLLFLCFSGRPYADTGLMSRDSQSAVCRVVKTT
jgi:hypothetical protein